MKKLEFDKLVDKLNVLMIEVHSGHMSNQICEFGIGKLLGVVRVIWIHRWLQMAVVTGDVWWCETVGLELVIEI